MSKSIFFYVCLNWKQNFVFLVFAGLLLICPQARAKPQVQITEIMYKGFFCEFIEVSNVGSTPIDLKNWSYDNSDRTPGTVDLSEVGLLEPGESFILTDVSKKLFELYWFDLPKRQRPEKLYILAEIPKKIETRGEANIYNQNGDLVERVSYDEEFERDKEEGEPRYVSVFPPAAKDLCSCDSSSWLRSTADDGFSWKGDKPETRRAYASPGILHLKLPITLDCQPCP